MTQAVSTAIFATLSASVPVREALLDLGNAFGSGEFDPVERFREIAPPDRSNPPYVLWDIESEEPATIARCGSLVGQDMEYRIYCVASGRSFIRAEPVRAAISTALCANLVIAAGYEIRFTPARSYRQLVRAGDGDRVELGNIFTVRIKPAVA